MSSQIVRPPWSWAVAHQALALWTSTPSSSAQFAHQARVRRLAVVELAAREFQRPASALPVGRCAMSTRPAPSNSAPATTLTVDCDKDCPAVRPGTHAGERASGSRPYRIQRRRGENSAPRNRPPHCHGEPTHVSPTDDLQIALVRIAALDAAGAAAGRCRSTEPPSVEDFFRRPALSGFQLSPDGKYLAAIVPIASGATSR